MANLKREKNVLELFANQRVAALTAKLLAVHGYVCRPSSTFTQALTAIGGGEIQVALVDFGTEPDDGCRFAAEAKKIAPSVSVIVCDSEPSVPHAQKVGASEAFDYLPCPFVVSDLVACLGRTVAVLSTLRKPQVALEAYLAAHGAERASPRAAPSAGETAAGEGRSDGAKPSSASEQLAAAVGKLKALTGGEPPAPTGVGQAAATGEGKASGNLRGRVGAPPIASAEDLLAGERVFLSELCAKGAIDSDLAAKAADKLAQEAAAPDGAVSAMAAIELLNEEAWGRAAGCVADLLKSPPVDLGVFPPDAKLIRGAANAAVLRARFAVPLAKLDDVTFVALPHPSPAAQAEVARAVGGTCRFFTCSALAAKAALDRALAPKEESAAS